MRWDRRFHRNFALAVLPVALWAALPAVQWCRPGTGPRIDCVLDVPVAGVRAASGATLATGSPQARCPAVAGCAASESRCDAAARTGGCPMAGPSCGTRRTSQAPSPRGTFCVQGSNRGAGVRTQPPTLAHHLIWAQAVSAPVVPEPPARPWRAHTEARVRPPTQSHHPLPPARAPPASMRTA